jgi:hypothetical protein
MIGRAHDVVLSAFSNTSSGEHWVIPVKLNIMNVLAEEDFDDEDLMLSQR